MGGTSADIGLVRDGEIQYVPDFELEFGLPIATPAIDLVTLGAGGGSIAWVDDGGLLRVGPRSAGAVPGPACYGLGGTEPTVTDANVVLGRIDPGSFLDGRLRLDPGRAHEALAALGRARRPRRRRGRRGGDRDRERGDGRHDPSRRGRARRRSPRLRARRVRRRRPAPRGRDRRVARHGGRRSCRRTRGSRRRSARCSPTGGSTAAGRTTRAPTPSTSTRSPHRLEAMERDARAALAAEGFAGEPAVVRTLSMRYAGQNYERDVPLPPGRLDGRALAAAFDAFHALHHEVYGYSFPGETIELIHANVSALGPGARPAPASLPEGDAAAAARGSRGALRRRGRAPHARLPARGASRPGDGCAVRRSSRSSTRPRSSSRARSCTCSPTGSCGSRATRRAGARREVDSVTVSVIGDQLVQIAQEMGTHMMRAAYSPIFSESRDFSCALFDRRGRMIAQGRFNPAHLGAIGETVRCVLAELGVESFGPGDVVLHNDPFRGGCHMPEHMLLRPVFYDGRARRLRRDDRPHGGDRRRHGRLVRGHGDRGLPGGPAPAAGEARACRRAGRGRLEDHPLEPPHAPFELGRPARDDRLARARRAAAARAARPPRRSARARGLGGAARARRAADAAADRGDPRRRVRLRGRDGGRRPHARAGDDARPPRRRRRPRDRRLHGLRPAGARAGQRHLRRHRLGHVQRVPPGERHRDPAQRRDVRLPDDDRAAGLGRERPLPRPVGRRQHRDAAEARRDALRRARRRDARARDGRRGRDGVQLPLRRRPPGDRRAVRPLPLRGERLGRAARRRREQRPEPRARQLPQHARSRCSRRASRSARSRTGSCPTRAGPAATAAASRCGATSRCWRRR